MDCSGPAYRVGRAQCWAFVGSDCETGTVADRLVVRGDDSRVELWSAGRLQFEPKGWQRQMRDELRAALAEMRDDPGRGQSWGTATHSCGDP
jgi:hypothetical protein